MKLKIWNTNNTKETFFISCRILSLWRHQNFVNLWAQLKLAQSRHINDELEKCRLYFSRHKPWVAPSDRWWRAQFSTAYLSTRSILKTISIFSPYAVLYNFSLEHEVWTRQERKLNISAFKWTIKSAPEHLKKERLQNLFLLVAK